MKEFKQQLLIIVVIIFGSLVLAYSTPLESKDSQETVTSSISTENKELHQKLKEGCEIDAYIEQGDINCEIKIRIKEDFKEHFEERRRLPSQEIEKAINVEMPRECIPDNGVACSGRNSQRELTLCGGDRLVYKTYKNKSKISSVVHWQSWCRRRRRVNLDTEIINHGVTYAEFFRAAEELMHRDKTKLGKGNIFRKKIVFRKIIPDSIFLLHKPTPWY